MKSTALYIVLFNIFCGGQNLLADDLIDWRFFQEHVSQNSNVYYDDIATRKLVRGLEKRLTKEFAYSQSRFTQENIERELLFLPSFVLKQRELGCFKELCAFEISVLLELEKYIAPSFVVFINEKPITVQLRLDILPHIAPNNSLLHLEIPEQLSLEDYFFANIAAYILGFIDLTALNIGIDKESGCPVFFDNEASFQPATIFKTGPVNPPYELHLTTPSGRSSTLYDDNFFYKKIDKYLVIKLKIYQQLLKNRYHSPLEYYLHKNRFLSEKEKEELLERINKIINFPFEIGTSFYTVAIKLWGMPYNTAYYMKKISSILGWDTGFGGTLLWIDVVKMYWLLDDPGKYDEINAILEDFNSNCIMDPKVTTTFCQNELCFIS